MASRRFISILLENGNSMRLERRDERDHQSRNVFQEIPADSLHKGVNGGQLLGSVDEPPRLAHSSRCNFSNQLSCRMIRASGGQIDNS